MFNSMLVHIHIITVKYASNSQLTHAKRTTGTSLMTTIKARQQSNRHYLALCQIRIHFLPLTLH